MHKYFMNLSTRRNVTVHIYKRRLQSIHEIHRYALLPWSQNICNSIFESSQILNIWLNKSIENNINIYVAKYVYYESIFHD